MAAARRLGCVLDDDQPVRLGLPRLFRSAGELGLNAVAELVRLAQRAGISPVRIEMGPKSNIQAYSRD